MAATTTVGDDTELWLDDVSGIDLRLTESGLLAADGLARPDLIPYSDIQIVGLSRMEPVPLGGPEARSWETILQSKSSPMTPVFCCSIILNSGKALHLLNITQDSDGRFLSRNGAYRDFVVDLHRYLVSLKADIDYFAGSPGQSPGQVRLVASAVTLLGITLLIPWPWAQPGPLAATAIILVVATGLYSLSRRNKPSAQFHPYNPAVLPQTHLPPVA